MVTVFGGENDRLYQVVIEGINTICFEKESTKKALPYIGYSLGGDGSRLGNANWLIKSTGWSHPGYVWIDRWLADMKNAEILEIGPGFGLMSYAFLKLYPHISISWMIFGDENKIELADNGYEKGLRKVKNAFEEGRINYFFGRIERDNKISNTFDVILMTEVFEHFALNPVKTLERIKTLLRPGGRLLLTTPNWGHLPTFNSWKELPENDETEEQRYLELLRCGHVYQYSKSELDDIFSDAGLKIEKYEVSESNNHNYLLY